MTVAQAFLLKYILIMEAHSILAALVVFGSLVISTKCDEINIPPGAQIIPYRNNTEESTGVVNGVRSCGGPGRILEWRYESCLDHDTICRVPADGIARKNEIDFVSGTDNESVGFRISLKSNDGSVNKNVDLGLVLSSMPLMKGAIYTFTVYGGANDELKGKRAVFQFILYDINGNQTVMCAEGDAIYV